MMMQGLLGLKWGDQSVFTTTTSGWIVRSIWAKISILIRRSITWGFSILNLSCDDSSLQDRP